MSSMKNKFRVAGAFIALTTLALAISCKGFFVNPTLTTITVDPPTPSISQGATQQMTATGTYQDGSTATLTGGTSCSGNTVCWSSSDTTIATITTGGLVTGVAQGTSTITAASGAITGTTTATIALSNITGLTLSETTYTISAVNDTVDAIAYAQTPGGKVDISATATWTTANTSIATVVGGTDPVVITGVATGSTTVTATYTTSTNTYTATATVTVQ
jgi:trimeric autotransporter adhesin